MDFRKLTIEDREYVERYSSGKLGWENSFACIWAWNVQGKHEICVSDEFVVLKNMFGGKYVFTAPYCSTNEAFLLAMREIKKYCQENAVNYPIINLSKDQVNLLSLEEYEISTNRNSYDYLYNTKDLVDLVGKKYHSKRNFVKRFTNKYDYKFRDYEKNDYDGVLGLLDKWADGRNPDDVGMEIRATISALDDYDKLNVKVAVLEVDGKIVGFSMGEVVSGVGHTLFEKADVNYEGIYPALNNLFAKTYYKDTNFINRQEDMGIEGLRDSKLSYHPVALLEKYRAKLK